MNIDGWQPELARPAWLYALAVLPLALYGARRSLVAAGALRRGAMIAVRVGLLVAAIIALGGPRLVRWEDRPMMVAAVDASASIGLAGNRKAEAYLEELRSHAANVPLAVFRFAAEPIDGNVGRATPPEEGQMATDIAAALAHARSKIPVERSPRIVVLSDGLQTQGDALAVARAQGDPLFTVPVPAWSADEVAVEKVRVISPSRVGNLARIAVDVRATVDTSASVVLECDEREVARQDVSLESGRQQVEFLHAPPRAGPVVYRARIRPSPDRAENDPRNDVAETRVLVRPAPRVLLADAQPAPAERLAEVLRRDGMAVDVVAPAAAATKMEDLARYDAVVLGNVPAEALADAQVAALDRYVRLGGGLIAVGGDQAFTPGGYRDTALERMLPVWSAVRVKEDRPTLALVLVIDRSESMRGASIALAREAARRAVETLEADAQVGILVFDEATRWVARLEPRDDRRPVLDAVATIEAGGRTDLYAGMEKAFLALRDAMADLKHMIVLSDGISHPGDFHALVRAIADEGITVSTVGLGREAEGPLLAEIAARGQGRYYAVRDAQAVPHIFAREARSAGRQGITEGPSLPRITAWTDALEGIDFSSAPSLLGYAETRAKPGSQVLLESDFGDPLLVRWRYGLGTAVAFASDATSRWSAAWLRWQAFEPFWQQVVRGALRRDAWPGVAVHTDWRSGQAVVRVDALDEDGQFVNRQQGELIRSGEASVPLAQVAPGRYEARFVPDRPGLQYGWLTLGGDGEPQRTAWSLDCRVSDELQLRTDDGGLMRELARATGGLYDARPADVLAAPGAARRQVRPQAVGFIGAALALLALDILLRRPVW